MPPSNSTYDYTTQRQHIAVFSTPAPPRHPTHFRALMLSSITLETFGVLQAAKPI